MSRADPAAKIHCFQPSVDAGEQAGYQVTVTIMANSKRVLADGADPYGAVDAGLRQNAYLKPALKRDNCSIIRAMAQRVIEDGRAKWRCK